MITCLSLSRRIARKKRFILELADGVGIGINHPDQFVQPAKYPLHTPEDFPFCCHEVK
jgi:hypothetical protein